MFLRIHETEQYLVSVVATGHSQQIMQFYHTGVQHPVTDLTVNLFSICLNDTRVATVRRFRSVLKC